MIVAHVCLGTVVSDGCMSNGLEFKTELGGWMFKCLLVYLTYMCFVSFMFVGGRGIHD